MKRYLEAQEYLEGASVNDKRFMRRFSANFFLSNGILYKHNHDSTLLRCIDKSEAERIMADLHEGTFAPTLVDTPWLKRSYGQDTIGPLVKQTVISIPKLVTNARFSCSLFFLVFFKHSIAQFI